MFKALNIFLIVFAILTINVYSSSFLSNRVLEDAASSNQNIEVKPLSDDTFSEINSLKSILANNHFKGKQDSEESDGKVSEIVNECSSKVVDGETVLVSCLITSTMKGKHSNKVIQQNLFFNEKTDYVLDTDQSVLKMSNIASQIIDTDDGNVVSEKKCHTNIAFSFVDTKDQKPFDYQSDKLKNLAVELKVSGGDCDITSTTPQLKLDTKYQVSIRVYAYIAFMVMLGLIQAVACGVLVIQIERNANYAKQASLGTLCFLVSFDFFIYLQHFTYWTTISNFMIIVFVLFFMIAVFFEPAILYFVFSTLQRRHNVSIRTLLLRIYFWVVVSATSVVLCKIYIPDLMLYALPLCLVPQIFDSMYNRQKYRWNFALLAGLMLPKLIYSTVLSLNIFKLFEGGVNSSLLVFTATAIILQAIVLKIQTRWPGLGIIKKSAKNLFSYECHKDEIETVSSVICSICTEKVGMNPIIGQQPTQDQEDPQTQPIMKTPCEHYYHESCLKEWFKKKFECPNCRQMLPPLETDDDE